MKYKTNRDQTTPTQTGSGRPGAIDHVAGVCQVISLKHLSARAGIFFYFLIFFLLVVSPQPAYSSGIGFLDFNGSATVSNSYFKDNFIGIMATTTNAASVANKTIDNIFIEGNDIYDSKRHGIKIDLVNTGAITIENNFLDNSQSPSNGRYGIRIQNHTSPSITNNTVQNFGRSGIQLQNISNITACNNTLFSNGSQKYSELYSDAQIRETRYYASGLQAIDSFFSFVVGNTITSNTFSGIADNLSGGTIGPNNTIMYNGDPNLGAGGSGGVTNCVIAAGGGGVIRGGVLVWNLPSANDTLSVCNNNISNNYNLNVAHSGVGSVYSCTNKVVPFFATDDDTVFYFDDSSGQVELDCLSPGLLYSDRVDANQTIDAAGKPFGIIIEGEASDVTVTNCTIKNAAMNDASRATTGNGSIIGAGIFIANNAEPSISNNYLFSNGWGLLDDRIYTQAGASGIQMRCSGADTRIFSNIFEANASDGLSARESGGIIGEAGRGNTFLNNARGGIGIYDGTIHNLEVAYNDIHSNQRGIGVLGFDGALLNINQNRIYSNSSTTSSPGGISFMDLSPAGTVSISNNTLTNNSGWKSGGIGLINSSLITVDFNIFSNTVSNNAQSGIGIQGAQGFTIRNNLIYSNGSAEFSIGTEYYGSGIQLRNASLTNEAIVDNTIHSNYFAGITAFDIGGTIGRSGSSANDIRFNGDINESGGLCAGVGGSGRGGISARGLTEDLFIEDPSYIVTSNYTKTAQIRPGSVSDLYYNGVKITSSFWTSDDVVLEIASDNKTLDCANPEQSDFPLITEIAGGKIWGITVLGEYTATIKNCSIYNNCTDSGDCNGDMGGGVLIAAGADVYMDNNTVFSNGYAAQPAGVGKCTGVAIRCAAGNTTLVNNTIENNLNDGLSVRDTGAQIGIAGQSNIFRNNGRAGISLFEGNTGNLEIAYNTIYNNKRGIGATDFEGATFTISNNRIYSNTGTSTTHGGLGFDDLRSGAVIVSNSIHNNKFGIGVHGGNENTNFSIANNYIFENAGSATVEFTNLGMAIGFGFGNPIFLGDAQIVSNWIAENRGGAIGGSNETLTAADPTMPGTFEIKNNTFINNLGYDRPAAVGLLGFSGDVTINSNYVYSNETIRKNVRWQGNSLPTIGIYWPGTTSNGASISIQNNMINSNQVSWEGAYEYDSDMIAIGISPYYDGSTPWGVNIRDVIITGNTLRNNDPGVNDNSNIIGLKGCHLLTNADVIINSNYIFRTGQGIGLKDFTAESAGTNTLSISNNTIYSSNWYFIEAKRIDADFAITDNVFEKGYYLGVRLDFDGNTGYRYDIIGNSITNVKLDGMEIDDIESLFIFSNNTIEDAGWSSGAGAQIRPNNWSDRGGRITNNTFRNNSKGPGLQMQGPSYYNIEGNLFYSNGNGSNSSTEYDAGLSLRSPRYTMVKNNTMRNNNGGGIGASELTNDNYSVTFLNNVITSNTDTGIGIGRRTGSGSNNGYITIGNGTQAMANIIRNNGEGGVGLFNCLSDIEINYNTITYNSALNNPAGIGLQGFGGTVNITQNNVSYNTVTSSAALPAGIGVMTPTAGYVTIDNNVIASNQAPDNSHVGGIGLQGMSAMMKGNLDYIYIISNRISNHRFGAGNQGAIAFRWLDFSDMVIRNNDKDGLGMSNNSCGIRFHTLADGVNVTIENNLIRDNINPSAAGGAGIEFMNTNYIDMVMDNNIISNCTWATPGNGDNKAVVAFQNCNQYSSNTIDFRRNQINTSNVHGVQFTAMNGAVGGHVAKIAIGSDLDAPGSSNNIINLPAEMRAIEFRYNNSGDIGVDIKNNNNLEGGIALSDNKLYYLTISGNTNIYSGQKGSDADAFYAGIQARDNITGLRGTGPSNLVPITISDNGIRDNRQNGMMLIADPVYCDLSMANNIVENNGRSGISVSLANVVTIVNNTIVSNGLENYNGTGTYDASGIRAKDSTLVKVTGNTIRYNLFSGIAAYNSGGTIGNDSPPQENIIMYNGNPDYPHLCEGIGNGRGGISARELDDNLYVYDANLIVTDNYHDETNSKPGMAVGDFYYNDEIVENDYFDDIDAVYFYNSFEDGAIDATLDCANPTPEQLAIYSIQNNTIDAAGKGFGVTIIGPETSVTVKNCTIKNAAYSYNFLRHAIEDKVVGAGIWIAANADAYIDNNYLVNNGLDLTKARFANGLGGTATNQKNFAWFGAGAAHQEGTNQLWIKVPSLSAGTNTGLYLYSGNAAAPAVWNGNTPIKKTFYEIDASSGPNDNDLVSLWQFDGSNCNDVKGSNEGTCMGIGFYGNDFRFFTGLIWQNMRGNQRKSMQVEEANGEYGYVAITDGSPSLDLTQAQSIVLWFSQGPGPLYTRKSATGNGGVELSATDDGRVEFKIENSSGQIYSAISPADSFDPSSRAAAQYVAAVYEGAGNKMKLYLQNTLVASTDVPVGFGDIYYNSAKSYLGAMDTNQDAEIDAMWGETFYGLLDEVGIYNLALTPLRVEALHYMRKYDPTIEGGNGWPTVTVGAAQSGPFTVDGYEWPTRWPVTVSNVQTALTNFQVGPVEVESPDSGGILMRCVDDGTTIVNNTLTSNARDAISGYSMDSALIGNNSLRNSQRFGFGMTSTVTNVRIFSNVIHDNDRGIGGREVYKGDAPLTIINNTLRNNDNTSRGWERFEISYSFSNAWVMIDNNLIDAGNKGIGFQNNDPGLDVTIRNNTIMNLANNPIRAEAYSAGSTFYIENNYINSNKSAISFRFGNAGNTTFLNNTVRNTQFSGFEGNDPGNITFDGNVFENSSSHLTNTVTTHSAIRFQFLAAGDMVDIKNNTFINNGKSGISLQECNGSAVSITNNYIYNSNWRNMGSQAAIRFQQNEDMSSIFIDNNDIFSNNSPGIIFAENEGTSVTISNNEITYNRRSGIGRGIEFQDNILGTSAGSSSYITVSNNSVEYNDDGIMFRENYDLNDVFISSNDVNYNLDTGVWLLATENVRLEGNNILNNPNIGLRIKNSSPLVGPTNSYIFSFQRAGVQGGAKLYTMAEIFNTGMGYCDSDSTCRGWYPGEFKADEPRLNTIRYGSSWGVQVRGEPNDATASIDGDTATEWKTAPSDTTLGSASHTHHSIVYDLNMVESVNKIRIYAKRRMSFWDVYLSTDGASWGSPVVSNWAIGGFMTPQWFETSFAAIDAKYIKLESEGGDDGNIWRDFFEFEYYTAESPGGVVTSNGDGTLTLDENTSTQWSTVASSTPHYIYYDLSFARKLTSVGIYGGAEEISYDVYVSNNTTSWGSAKITDWSVGGRVADPPKAGALGDQTSLSSTQVRLDSGAAADADTYNDMVLVLTGYQTDGVLGDQTSLGSTQVRLDSADASPDSDYYNDMTLVLTSGSGAPVEVTITDYSGSPDYLCTVSPGYSPHPAENDTYEIHAGYPVEVTITDYSGSPDYLCTVSPAYTTHPVEDDSYAIYPAGGVGAALSGYLYTSDITATGRYIKLESTGGVDTRILDDFYEFQYWSDEEGDGGNIESVCSTETDDEDSGLDKGNDGNTSTQWRTHPGDMGHATHWISYDLGSDVSGINGLRIYTGSGSTHSWDVYVTRSVMTPVPVGDRVADDWSVSGNDSWTQTTFSAKTGRYIRWETAGRTQIKDYFYEVQYTTNGGSSWITPPIPSNFDDEGTAYGSIGGSGPLACSYARKYAMTPVFTGGQVRGNSSTQIGIRGANTDAYLYGLHMGGGVESISAADDAVVFWENSNSHGNNTAQSQTKATLYIQNGSWINQKTRTTAGTHLWMIDNNFASAINCFMAGGGCPAYCGGGGGTTHVINNNHIPAHTGAIGSTHIIFNGGNEMHGLSACGGGTMDFIDDNHASLINFWYCSEGRVVNEPNCNRLTGIGYHPTGSCCCTYAGTCSY